MSSLLKNLNMEHVKVHKHVKPPKEVRAEVTEETLEAMLQQILSDRFVPFQSVTPEQRDEIITFEQHFADGGTNPKWLNARMDLATGSRLAGMVGWSPYETVISTLMNMLWRKFRGNAATRWGTEHEPDAQNTTEAYFQSLNGSPNPVNPKEIQTSAVVKEVGLVRSVAFPFGGMSPDGILIREFKHVDTGDVRVQRQLLEFKCPYKRRGLNDHWPGYDLYEKKRVPHVPGTPLNTKKQPVPQYYYTQLMWGGLIMGHHHVQSIIHNPNVDAAQLRAFMSQCPDAKLNGMCGANMIDVEHPILFIVWAPCADITSEIDVPECYVEDQEAGSKFIRTRHGAIQLTEVEYNHDFTTWMLETVFDFWRNKYMPRLVKKNAGVLLRGELDVPETLSDSGEEEE